MTAMIALVAMGDLGDAPGTTTVSDYRHWIHSPSSQDFTMMHRDPVSGLAIGILTKPSPSNSHTAVADQTEIGGHNLRPPTIFYSTHTRATPRVRQ